MLRFRRLRRFCTARLTLCSSRTVWLARRVRKIVRLSGPAWLSWRVLRAVLTKLARLPGMLRSTRRHIGAVSTHDAWRVECAGSRGCSDGRMAAIRPGAQGRVARGLLHMRVLRSRRRYVLFGCRSSLLRSG